MPRKKVRPPWVDARSLSLEQWLQYVLLPEDEQPEAFENFRFATRTLREQFIATIGDRTDQEIRVILRQFLLMGGNLGADGRRLLDYASQPDIKELLEEREYVRRLFNQKRHTWELCKRFNSVFGPNWTSEAPRIIRQGMVAAATNRKGT